VLQVSFQYRAGGAIPSLQASLQGRDPVRGHAATHMRPFTRKVFARRSGAYISPFSEKYMTEIDQRYLSSRTNSRWRGKPPVFAKVMRSKEGVFEGVSFIKSKDKASVLTIEQANQAIAWANRKSPTPKSTSPKSSASASRLPFIPVSHRLVGAICSWSHEIAGWVAD
jgi:hypothetical protein